MPIYTPIFKKSTEFIHINNNYLKFIIKLIAGYKINIYMCNMKKKTKEWTQQNRNFLLVINRESIYP